MAILRRSLPYTAPLLVLVLLGCALVGSIFRERPASGFPHRVHVEGLEMSCSDCHASVEDSDAPGMPEASDCLLCHGDLDDDKSPERRASAFLDGDAVAAVRLSALADEVRFSHRAHAVDYGLACASCHGDVGTSDGIGSAVRVTMADCSRCHEETSGRPESDCALCHREIDTQWLPPTHERDWTRFHGLAVNVQAPGPSNQCSLCHDQTTYCNACHQEQLPRDHNHHFRRRGHLIAASIDRDRCAVCHRSDFCDRCHSVALPRSHRGSFGSPRNRHCLGCHFPLQDEGCFTCHKTDPIHAMAPPQPPWHTPGMNCRQCHGAGIPLRHPDNGGDCNRCHR